MITKCTEKSQLFLHRLTVTVLLSSFSLPIMSHRPDPFCRVKAALIIGQSHSISKAKFMTELRFLGSLKVPTLPVVLIL